MMRCMFVRVGMVILALFALTAPALAGGFTVVTLDALPEEPRAGETLTLGFMVRQHGISPNSNVEPLLLATNTETGATLRAEARQDGPEGHFVVDVSFPAEGTWEWQITPEPFPATKLGRVTVLPAAATAAEPATAASVESPAPMIAPSALRWAGALLVLAAVAMALAGQRGRLGRQRALQPR